MISPLRSLAVWARMVKFSHTLFALPFALSGAGLAALRYGIRPGQVFWIAVAMVAARNAAMGFNRLADHAIDARNPRTATRELPTGALSRGAVAAVTALLAALFVLASWMLQPICGLLSPIALLTVLGHSYSKRFTWSSHLLLGLAISIAPVGGWLAVAGEFAWTPWLLAAAVLAWVAGFDVIYACQDVDFDRREGLHSIPARFGVEASLRAARLLHAVAFLALVGVGLRAALHPVYWLGLGAIALLLIHEHRIVHARDLSRLGVAFFNMNGIISVVYLLTVVLAGTIEVLSR